MIQTLQHLTACSSISGVFRTIASAWLFKSYPKALLPSWKFSELVTEALLWKCSCCCLTTAVTTGPPVFHTLKVTLTKVMPGKVTVSSQQFLLNRPSAQRKMASAFTKPLWSPTNSPGNCTQRYKSKERQRSSQSSCQGLSEVGPTERGSAEPCVTYIKCSCTQEFTPPFLQESFPSSLGTKALLSP